MVMNNYPDDNPGTRLLGEQSVVGVAYSDGPDGDVSLPAPVMFDGEGRRVSHRQMEPVEVGAVAQNAVVTVDVEYQPDFWTVQVPTTANVLVDVYVGTGRLIAPHAKLGADWGRFARLPGRGVALTLVGSGSQSVTPVVTAYHGWGCMAPDVVTVEG